MKFAVSILTCLMLFSWANAQNLRLGVLVRGGIWSGGATFNHSYSNDYQRQQGWVGGGITSDFRLANRLLFSPELGLEAILLRLDYSNARDFRSIVAHSNLYMARVSPGLTFQLTNSFSARAGLSFLVPVWTNGTYDLIVYYPAIYQSETYHYGENFGAILSPVLWGAELNLDYIFLRTKKGSLGLRLSSFLSFSRLFKEDFDTPFNPRIRGAQMGLIYRFGNATTN